MGFLLWGHTFLLVLYHSVRGDWVRELEEAGDGAKSRDALSAGVGADGRFD